MSNAKMPPEWVEAVRRWSIWKYGDNGKAALARERIMAEAEDCDTPQRARLGDPEE